MPRNGRKTRQEQATEVARKAAHAAAAAVLEAADNDEEDDEMEESIMPGDDGRPKTQKGRSAPAAGGPAKDVKLGSEGPDAVKKSRVQERLDRDEEEEENESRNPLGKFLERVHNNDDDDEDEMQEAAADDQLTRTEDSTRLDAQRKRQSSTHSGDIGNEVTDDSHPAVPAGNAVVEAQMAGVPVACSNAGSLPEVAGESAMLFDPRSVDEIAGALHRCLRDSAVRELLVQRGRANVRRYSWERSARTALDVYRRCVEVQS